MADAQIVGTFLKAVALLEAEGWYAGVDESGGMLVAYFAGPEDRGYHHFVTADGLLRFAQGLPKGEPLPPAS